MINQEDKLKKAEAEEALSAAVDAEDLERLEDAIFAEAAGVREESSRRSPRTFSALKMP